MKKFIALLLLISSTSFALTAEEALKKTNEAEKIVERNDTKAVWIQINYNISKGFCNSTTDQYTLSKDKWLDKMVSKLNKLGYTAQRTESWRLEVSWCNPK